MKYFDIVLFLAAKQVSNDAYKTFITKQFLTFRINKGFSSKYIVGAN